MNTQELDPSSAELAPDPQTSDEQSTSQLAGMAVRGGVMLLASRLLVQAALWVVTLWIARLLTPYDYGMMTAGMIFLIFADLLAEAGFGSALIHKPNLKQEDLDCAFTVSLLLSVVLYGLLWALAPYAADFLELPPFSEFLRVLGIQVLLIPFRTISLAVLDRELKMGRQAMVHVVVSLLQSGTVLLLALFGMGYWALAAGAFVARTVDVGLLAYLSGARPGFALPTREQRGLLWFGMHASLGGLLWYFYSKSDAAQVSKLGADALGWYALAFQLVSMPVEKLTANANRVAYPVFCRLKDRPEQMRDWYLRLTVLLGLFGMPALAGLALVAPEAFGVLLGERWLPAIVPFRLLCIVGIIMLYGASLPPLFNALGRPDLNLRFTAACAAVMPLAFYAGRKQGGLIGICVAWLICYPFLVAGFVHFTRGTSQLGLPQVIWAQRQVISAVVFMTGCVGIVRWSFTQGIAAEWPMLVHLVLAILTGMVSYAGFLLGFARNTVLADLQRLLREVRGGARG